VPCGILGKILTFSSLTHQLNKFEAQERILAQQREDQLFFIAHVKKVWA
jgi:hypothetical protein